MHDRRSWVLAAMAPAMLAGALLVGGCEERATSATRQSAAPEAVSDSASTADAQPAGATQPQAAADTQPANSFLTVDGRITEFPAARLRLSKTAEGVNAQLFSDDPRTATSADYKGNSFYFELPLQVADPSDVRQAAYAYKADDSEPSETPYGIFLVGTKYHLQPQDVVIRFDGEGRRIMAQVTGRFLVVRSTAEQGGVQSATVQGTLYTTAEVEQ